MYLLVRYSVVDMLKNNSHFIDSKGKPGFGLVASYTFGRQGVGAFGGLKRKSFTGGAMNGIPYKSKSIQKLFSTKNAL